MKIPKENLTAMIEFLTKQSETSGDHFMVAAWMLQAQQASITKLETKVAIWRKALEHIALWPDGGSNYGQPKIKEFAVKVLSEHAAVGEEKL